MAKIVIIGGSGHVGTYLVPRLVEAGHEVVNVTRGKRLPYTPNGAWNFVETVLLDRDEEDRTGVFPGHIARLNGDIVIDMIAFHRESTQNLVAALDGRVQHFLHCGTIWVYGGLTTIPATEDFPKNPFGEYGSEKAAQEDFLLAAARRGFPATVFRPGHIVGPGWAPLNPAGNFNLAVFNAIARGEMLVLPDTGEHASVHHVHADDVAQIVMGAINNRHASVGEAFNAVSAQAVTLRGYAEATYRYFGHRPTVVSLPFERWKDTLAEADWKATVEHISRSPSHSIAKAQKLLGYQPRYTSLQAVFESLAWLVANGEVTPKGPAPA